MNIRKNIVITLTFLVVSMVLGGCRAQAQLPAGPVYFVDAKTGKNAAPVLLIPNYGTFSGISTGAGHGPTKGRNGLLFAHPFIYRSDGSPFKVKQPLSTAIGIPPYLGLVHKGISLNGIDVYSKGYKIEDISIHLLYQPRPKTFRLEPLGEAESKEEFARISDGLHNKNFEVLLNYPSIPVDYVLEFDFTKKELKMMEDFFAADTKTE